jgi:hypothetical protein
VLARYKDVSASTARRALGLLFTTALFCLAPLLAGTSSAYADATCPSSWGFDGGYFVGLDSPAAIPGWFGGVTTCNVRLQSFDNWSAVTDSSTRSTVATTDHYTCGPANNSCATWGIGTK